METCEKGRSAVLALQGAFREHRRMLEGPAGPTRRLVLLAIPSWKGWTALC